MRCDLNRQEVCWTQESQRGLSSLAFPLLREANFFASILYATTVLLYVPLYRAKQQQEDMRVLSVTLQLIVNHSWCY